MFLIMTHTHLHTYIDLFSTWAKKCFSLHGELCWRQTAGMVGLRGARTTGVHPATQIQSLFLPSLSSVYVRCWRNNSSHKALIKPDWWNPTQEFMLLALVTEQWHRWTTVWWCVQLGLMQLPIWQDVPCSAFWHSDKWYIHMHLMGGRLD